MKKFVQKIEEKNFSTREYCLIGVVLTLMGILLGIMFSPKGKRVIGSNNGNNNGNNNTNNLGDDLCEDEEE